MKNFVGWAIIVVLLLPFVGWMSTRVVFDILFRRNIEGHLKRAADASTIELAEKELSGVVGYLEDIKMTFRVHLDRLSNP